MKTILAISGSLRLESKNTRILLNLKKHFEGKLNIVIFDQMALLPHFNPDIENNNLESVQNFRKCLQLADSVLISSPEYAHGIPGSLKNALDWVVGSGELIDKKIGLLYTSSSPEEFVKEQLFEVIKTISAKIERSWCVKVSGVEITPEIIELLHKL